MPVYEVQKYKLQKGTVPEQPQEYCSREPLKTY